MVDLIFGQRNLPGSSNSKWYDMHRLDHTFKSLMLTIKNVKSTIIEVPALENTIHSQFVLLKYPGKLGDFKNPSSLIPSSQISDVANVAFSIVPEKVAPMTKQVHNNHRCR